MPKKIVLVSCVSEKRAAPSPTCDLYTSDWFTKVARYAGQIADEWFILSAKYGLVHPDKTIPHTPSRDSPWMIVVVRKKFACFFDHFCV